MAQPLRYAQYRLQPGYAETSTKRCPRMPETVVVGSAECDATSCVGMVVFDSTEYMAFKVKGKNRYYFQLKRG